MGGAEDMPQRSSSPLKRPASELEPDVPLSSQKEDVDMVMVPDTQEDSEVAIAAPTAIRAVSMDMLRDESTKEDAAQSVTATENVQNIDPKTEIPPIDVQVATVTSLIRAARDGPLTEGDKTYLVSRKWLEKVTSNTSEARAKSKKVVEEKIGPVDNSNIIQQIIPQPGREDFVQLKHGIGEDLFELFPGDAWDMVLEWHDIMTGTKPIVRFAHNTNPDKGPNAIANVSYEYHPPIFHIHRVWSELGDKVDAATKSANPDAPVVVASRSMRMHDFLKLIKEIAGVPIKQKIRLWRVPRTLPAADPALSIANGAATPPSSRPGTPTVDTNATAPEVQDSWKKLLLGVADFTKVERDSGRMKIEFEDSTVNENYNGNLNLGQLGLGDDQAIVIDELVEGKDGFVSNTRASPNGKANGVGRKNNSSIIVSSQNNSGRNSPAPSSSYNLRSFNRKSKNGRTPGTVGLGNLGNTCYMNSALQCVRSVEELTKYFVHDVYKAELNSDNPLGHGGCVAKAYADLLKEIYKEPAPVSVQPRNFKNTVSRFATQFSGYGQQDSQEFIGFLLDGLQEDLSRVRKKPYIEKPDSTDEMIGNPEAIREMATKVWDITKQRDDSVIADLFTGMYKSTLVCPHCDKVSITFDPFNNMTLQLPIESIWTRIVNFFPLNDKPVSVVVETDKHASVGTLKRIISQKVGVPAERIFSCEVYEGKFYKWYLDHEVASEAIEGAKDIANFYELETTPTNLPKDSGNKHTGFGKNNSTDNENLPWDSPEAEKLLVPVFHRRPKRERFGKKPTSGSWELTLTPHFIVVNRNEARSEEAIKRKLLEKVSTFTTWPSINDEYDPSSASESIDPDLVVTTGSDADSSGDGKFVAQSLDGEDELVDVAMKDSNPVHESTEQSPGAPLKVFNSRRPKWIDPAEFLAPELQNLFEISYIVDAKGGIPTAWAVNLDSTRYPKISERNPQVHQINEDDASNDYDAIDSTAGSISSKSSRESSDDTNGLAPSITRMTEDLESDDDALKPISPHRALPVRPAAPKSGARGKSVARKRHQSEAESEQDAPDDGPLIRLGEGIVVDWNEDAWETLFGSYNDSDNFRGRPTYENPPTLVDLALDSKRQARESRRKQGITLEDCLDEFGKEEILSEMDTWYCPRCKEHRRASKKFEIWRTPDILIMHLKRFSASGFQRNKLVDHVDFPIEGLDLSSRVIESQDGKEEIYDLIAVDDHYGGMGGGHYTAFAKNFSDQKWYEYNDSSVSETKNLNSMVTKNAYLLFYRRRSSEPLGGKALRDIVNSLDNASSDEEDSGEGRRLGENSSQHGSPSALTGVGAALRRPELGSEDGGARTTVNLQALEHAPLDNDDTQDMSDQNNVAPNLHQQSWGFEAFNHNSPTFASGAASEAGEAGSLYGSDGIEHGSNPDQATKDERELEFNNAMVDEDYQESYIPDTDVEGPNPLDVMAVSNAVKQRNRAEQRNYEIPVDTPEDEEPATEIHVEEGEGV
ncbi:Bcubp12 [Botrytis cinerea B05.10]|uniref:ubiquitinyl hydrolase 1 n=1 Tax=Botryotinia fuckeliana (strain B05.10) TaxID=332648 RepID=A0A384JN91_BOTFB|nr:Bcubp12 [Botrytis cinerea B05.10]ATZ52048.1 Bcubp12 [Botrytis cinerea B05.10]